MKCEMGECKSRAKLQLSMENGWRQRLCFRHSYKILRTLIRNVHEWNRSLYIQKVPES